MGESLKTNSPLLTWDETSCDTRGLPYLPLVESIEANPLSLEMVYSSQGTTFYVTELLAQEPVPLLRSSNSMRNRMGWRMQPF